MSKKESLGRRMRRWAMREQGQTFKDRLREAIRTGKPVKTVNFVEGKAQTQP